jgi:hypothetical protein
MEVISKPQRNAEDFAEQRKQVFLCDLCETLRDLCG